MEEDDPAVVARVVAGDTASFEILMRRHNARVFRTMRAILKNDDEAEDAMQQAYVSAFTHLRDFGNRARFSTWLTRIAVHEALARLRRAKKHASLDDEGDTAEANDVQQSRHHHHDLLEQASASMTTSRTPEDAASDIEMRGLLEEAVDALPIAFRSVFVLRAVEEMTVGETAEALSIPEETVRTRLHRARGVLREHLAKKLEGAAPALYEFHLSRCDRVVAAVFAALRKPK